MQDFESNRSKTLLPFFSFNAIEGNHSWRDCRCLYNCCVTLLVSTQLYISNVKIFTIPPSVIFVIASGIKKAPLLNMSFVFALSGAFFLVLHV
jgi:hypothetical protein